MIQRRTSQGMQLLVRDELVEAAEWRNFLENPCAESRMSLFDRYLPFARRLSRNEWRRIGSLGLDLSDIDQIACEAMLQAIDRFDPYKGVPFTAYARIRIRGAVHNELGHTTEAAAVYGARRRMERDRLRSLKERATAASDNPLALLRELAAGIAIGFVLEGKASVEVENVQTADPSAYDAVAWQQLVDELKGRLGNIPERERLILDYHYRQDIKFQEIAKLLGVSKGRVSQLHAQALQRLRNSLSRFR